MLCQSMLDNLAPLEMRYSQMSSKLNSVACLLIKIDNNSIFLDKIKILKKGVTISRAWFKLDCSISLFSINSFNISKLSFTEAM